MKSLELGTPRKARKRRRKDGRDVPVKNAASATNARARKIAITGHGGSSRTLLHGGLHLGSRVGRAYLARCSALVAHVGGQPSEVQRALIDQAARLHLLANMAYGELLRVGAFKKSGDVRAAFDAYRKAASDERDVLRLIGIERRAAPVPSLQDYLEQRGEQAAEPQEKQD
jgi:hypothetical protein